MRLVAELGGVRLFHGDARELHRPPPRWRSLVRELVVDGVLVTDPPYGIAYRTGYGTRWTGEIRGDHSADLAELVVGRWTLEGLPAAVFSTWKVPRPPGQPAIRLVWDKGAGSGMGDLAFPWGASDEEIWIFGEGWRIPRGEGRRGSIVPANRGFNGALLHPHEKPLALLEHILRRAPDGMVFDPFAGSGTTLVAAARLGRAAVGIESDPRWVEVARRRLLGEGAQLSLV